MYIYTYIYSTQIYIHKDDWDLEWKYYECTTQKIISIQFVNWGKKLNPDIHTCMYIYVYIYVHLYMLNSDMHTQGRLGLGNTTTTTAKQSVKKLNPDIHAQRYTHIYRYTYKRT